MHVEIRGLSKVYPGGVHALEDVDLDIDRGLHGLLGPNGAGKTTLMKILCTLLEPSSGSIRIDGRDLAEDRDAVRSRLGYLGQEWGAPGMARCWEVLDLVLSLRGVAGSRARREAGDRLLDQVGLLPLRKRKLKTLSGGQRRRLGVAQALAGDPELIVMDEPTVGLDPDERVEFRNLLSHLGQERAIVLSTHIVADVGTTCEKVAILDRGRVHFEGPPADFVKRAEGRVWDVEIPDADPRDVREFTSRGATVVSTHPVEAGVCYRLASPDDLSSAPGARPADPTLEDAYLLEVGLQSADVAGA